MPIDFSEIELLPENIVVLSLGSNIEPRAEYLNKAILLIKVRIGKIVGESEYIETPPWGNLDLSPFINAAILVESRLNPQDLLNEILKIEIQLGRVRQKEKWQARTIDIDIIYFGNLILEIPELIIPHPFAHERTFVLKPICELIPNYNHPVLKCTQKGLLERLKKHD